MAVPVYVVVAAVSTSPPAAGATPGGACGFLVGCFAGGALKNFSMDNADVGNKQNATNKCFVPFDSNTLWVLTFYTFSQAVKQNLG